MLITFSKISLTIFIVRLILEEVIVHRQGVRIPEGPGTDVLVNRWLRDPSGSGAYRVPDVRLMRTGKILDGTIGDKTMSSPQVQDFINLSGGQCNYR